jgi:fibronectin-binding autotransporter adhesin
MPTSALPLATVSSRRGGTAVALAALACLLVALPRVASAQTTTTLGASFTTTAMESSTAIATSNGLTLNLGLGFEYLIVGGGGGGGGNIGGGGGAGGLLTNVGGTTPAAVLSSGTAAVTVGGGGAGGSINNLGTSGSSSTAFNVTAAGGGGGGFYNASGGTGSSGLAGASGGGGSPSNGTTTAAGGNGTSGNNGGSATRNGGNYNAGGGGGAGSAGTNATQSVVGTGGAGASSSITGSAVTYAAGGGGGSTATGAEGGSSGLGGSGGGGVNNGTSGQANTGSGGGGGGYNGGFGAVAGGAGGSGVVIVRYRSATSLTSGGNTSGGYNDGSDDWQFERFTAGGTLTVNALDAANLRAIQSGVISGTGGLTYDSPGTLRLTAANTFSGATQVAAGTLELGNALALQNSTLNLATADAGTVAFTVPGTTTYTLRALLGTRSLDIGGNSLSLGGANAVTTYSGDLSGTGGLTKNGTGTLTLSGNNSFSGGLVVNGGTGNSSTVVAGSNTAFGTGPVTINGENNGTGSTLDLNGRTLGNAIGISFRNTGVSDRVLLNSSTATTAVLNGTLTIGGENYVGGAGNLTLNGLVTGGTSSYSFFKQDAGTWTFANEANTFDGFYYQIGGVTEVTKLANAGETSSLGQVSAGQNQIVFGFNNAGGGTIRYIGSSASTSDRAFSLRGSTDAASNTIEAAGTSAAATLTLTGGLSAGRSATFTARLAGDNAGENVYAGVIANGSGTVALEKTGGTTWALTGANTYSGATTISAGTLNVGAGGTTGSLGGGAVSVASGATLVFDRSNGLTVANAISGSGVVAQAGSGTTSLTAANTYTGATDVAAGTLSIGNGGTGGAISSSSAVTIAAGATLAVDRSNAITLSNAIIGNGAVAKRGTGTLTLSGGNSHAGGTRLEGGTLVVGSDTALGSGPVVFAAAGATLETTRNITNPIAMNANGTLAAGSGTIELSGDFTGSGTLTKTGTGTLTLLGAASTFTGDLVIGGGSGLNSIVKAGSANAFGSGTVTILGGGGNTGSTFDLNGFSLDNGLVIGQGNSGVGNTGALQNNGATPAILNGPVSSGGEIYVGGAGDITFNGVVSGGVNPSNPYSFYKDGTGTWTFTNTANTFDGFYYVFNGATEVASLGNINQPSALGQPTDATRNRVVFGFSGDGGGTLRYVGAVASTSDRGFVLSGLTGAERNTIEAAGTSAAATLTLTGGLSASRAGNYTARLAGDNAGVNEYAGVIANGSGTVALEKTGGTTWALTGANTYSGATTVSAGTLRVGNGGGTGTLGGGAVSVASGATLAFDRSNTHTVANVIGGSGSVAQAGSGITTLSGANTFSGGTTIAAGTLAVAAIADSGTSNLGTSGTLALAGGTLEYTGSGAATTARVVDISAANTTSTIDVSDAAGSLTLTGKVWNTDATHPNVVLNKTGSGTLEIGGTTSNTRTSLAAAAGTVVLNNSERAVYEIRALDAGATVRLAANQQVFSGDATATTGNIRMTGGTLDLAGHDQTINRLVGADNSTAGTGTITSSTPATFTVGNNFSGRPSLFDGGITGDVAVVTRGSNPITLGGTSSYTGPTNVTGSRLSVNGSLGSTAVTVAAAAELGGSGTIGGSVLVQDGGRLAPGNSIESLAVGATTFEAGATFAYEIDSTAALAVGADLLVVTGGLNIATGSILEFSDLAAASAQPIAEGTVFALINYTGTWNTGLFSLAGQPLANNATFLLNDTEWRIRYDSPTGGSNFTDDYVSGSFVTVTAVPEPSTLALLATAGLGLAALARQRRHRKPVANWPAG